MRPLLFGRRTPLRTYVVALWPGSHSLEVWGDSLPRVLARLESVACEVGR
jgi:hypothetical protein